MTKERTAGQQFSNGDRVAEEKSTFIDARPVRFHIVTDSDPSTTDRTQNQERNDEMANGSVNAVVPLVFLRNDSIIIRLKPGQCFSEFANIAAEPVAACDPKLGTLGELRHHLRTGTSGQVKRFVRNNPWSCGHRIRAELWKELCRNSKSDDAHRAVYKDFLVSLGSLRAEPAFLTAPGVVASDYQLKENGRMCLLRLLVAIEHQRPDFTYIPILYPLCALFLHYMSEDDAFVCVMNLLSHSQKFLIQTDIAAAASKRTLVVLLKKHVNRVYVFLQKLSGNSDDKDLVQLFDDWTFWLFRDLPFTHLVRMIDCFLFEGQKVLFRVALAIIHLWYKTRYKYFRHRSDVTCRLVCIDIGEFCRSIKTQPQKLLKVAFAIRNLKMSTVVRLQQKHELNIRRNNSALAEIASTQNFKQLLAAHNFLDVRLNTNILTNSQAMQLIMWLPTRYQLFTPSRLFSTEEDGRSFTRFWSKIDDYYPTIIVISTPKGEIFGAYCSTQWSLRRRYSSVSYFGTGESFLFRLSPTADRFGWVGSKKSIVSHNEELFQSAGATTLIVGGGTDEGLSIRQCLDRGSSGRSDTFCNPQLSCQCDFEIQSLEVFGFVAEE